MGEDYVNHPSHYTYGGKECIDVIKDTLTPDEYAGYLKGTQIKYVFRHGHKWNPVEDLEKAEWYRARYCDDFGYISNTEADAFVDACRFEFNLSSQDTGKLIQEYITSIDQDNPYFAKAILEQLLTNASEAMSDNAEESMMSTEDLATSFSDIFDRHNGNYRTASLDDAPEIEDCANVEDHELTPNARIILDGLHFLAAWDPDLWEYAYFFNYDDLKNVLTVDTQIRIRLDDTGDRILTPITIKMCFISSTKWDVRFTTKSYD